MGSIAYAQNAARKASVTTTAITMMTVFNLLNATTRSPQSGHFGTSWSKLTPQAGQVWRIGPPVSVGSSGIAGGYAERASGDRFPYGSTNSANHRNREE
jgi:hypothetical protein